MLCLIKIGSQIMGPTYWESPKNCIENYVHISHIFFVNLAVRVHFSHIFSEKKCEVPASPVKKEGRRLDSLLKPCVSALVYYNSSRARTMCERQSTVGWCVS